MNRWTLALCPGLSVPHLQPARQRASLPQSRLSWTTPDFNSLPGLSKRETLKQSVQDVPLRGLWGRNILLEAPTSG